MTNPPKNRRTHDRRSEALTVSASAPRRVLVVSEACYADMLTRYPDMACAADIVADLRVVLAAVDTTHAYPLVSDAVTRLRAEVEPEPEVT